jgi:hypothetical protein
VWEYVTLEHLLIDLKFDSLNDNLPDATHEAVVCLPARQSLDLRMSADEKAVVRIRLTINLNIFLIMKWNKKAGTFERSEKMKFLFQTDKLFWPFPKKKVNDWNWTEETPGTPMPGWAKMSSTDKVTTFLALTAETSDKIHWNDLLSTMTNIFESYCQYFII